MIGTSLKDHWLSQSLEVNPGVSREELTAFESKYQVSLPSDLRDYFLTVNGMAEGEPTVMFDSFSELVSDYLTDPNLLLTNIRE